ncbi:MAG: outer membrane lipoprotein-sorting protein [Candidatus Kapabacteria bacterium]|nr:outer membrane lipoprotein-sorting protein [Candidatus Kapabacteria bacterium]
MKKSVLIIFLLLFAVSLQAIETIESVIQKHNIARGGIEKIAKIQNWIFQSESNNKLTNIISPATTYYKNNKFKIDIEINKKKSITAWDGLALWTINPMSKSDKPTIVPKSEERNYIAQMSQQRDVITIGPLQDYVLRGAKPSLEREEKLDGLDCYKIKMSLKDGDIFIWLHKTDFMIYKVEAEIKAKDKKEKIMILLSSYKKIDGFLLPYKFETFIGKQSFSVVNIKEIKVNPKIDDKIFKMPITK